MTILVPGPPSPPLRVLLMIVMIVLVLNAKCRVLFHEGLYRIFDQRIEPKLGADCPAPAVFRSAVKLNTTEVWRHRWKSLLTSGSGATLFRSTLIYSTFVPFHLRGGATADRTPRIHHIWTCRTPPGGTVPVECPSCSRRGAGNPRRDLSGTCCFCGSCSGCVNHPQSMARIRPGRPKPTAGLPARAAPSWPPCRPDSSARTETLRGWRYTRNAGRLLPLLASSHVSFELLFRMRNQIWEIYFRGTTKLKFLYVFGEAHGGGGGGVTPLSGIIFEHFKSGIGCRIYLFCSYIGKRPVPLSSSLPNNRVPARGHGHKCLFWSAMGFGGKKRASWVWERKGQKEKGGGKLHNKCRMASPQ